MDIETTGLNPRLDYILELGFYVTDQDLNVTGSFCELVWNDPGAVEERLGDNPAVAAMHGPGGSGLIAEMEDAKLGVSAAWNKALGWLRAATGNVNPAGPHFGPMCGSSVHFDRAFLAEHMPGMERQFHYRNLDISGIREAAKLWAPHLLDTAPTEQKRHRALPDLDDTLALARHFRTALFGAVDRVGGAS